MPKHLSFQIKLKSNYPTKVIKQIEASINFLSLYISLHDFATCSIFQQLQHHHKASSEGLSQQTHELNPRNWHQQQQTDYQEQLLQFYPQFPV